MILKNYQQGVLDTLSHYLQELSVQRQKVEELRVAFPDFADSVDFAQKAWKEVDNSGIGYQSLTNTLGQQLPSVTLKIPTGGGKTMLACHAIDLIHHLYKKQRTGLVVWVVPSSTIYRQTVLSLRDRAHPYRQILDKSSGGKTLILEKNDKLQQADLTENLVVLVLMLQSANRKTKDQLKFEELKGGFEGFFPQDDQYRQHQDLLAAFPNLETEGAEGDVFGRLVRYSFANVLRISRPIIIMDEGHKSYSRLSRETLTGFNPCFLLELTATPTEHANVLTNVRGRDLDEEGMIKLDIRVQNREDTDWRVVLLAGVARRDELEKKADEYRQECGVYIRPINLIQVERTGKEQRGNGFIHAEDVKDELMQKHGVPERYIAIKSSDKDDLEGQDLLSPDNEVRYIITKQALQEGWDCSFAYVLTVLSNPNSKTALTQLIGRVLRQPYAVKTGVKLLDECYVFTFRRGSDLVKSIKDGLESEGLGDIAGKVSLASGEAMPNAPKYAHVRPEFAQFVGRAFLPKFVLQDEQGSHDLDYTRDIVSDIDWSQFSISDLEKLVLGGQQVREKTIGIDLDELLEIDEKISDQRLIASEAEQAVFLARQISQIIPNPWQAFELMSQLVSVLCQRYTASVVQHNLVYLVEEVIKDFQKQIEVQTQQIFSQLLDTDKMRFVLMSSEGAFELPSSIQYQKPLIDEYYRPVQHSLFDFVDEDGLNPQLERPVALMIDKQQEKLMWWYRNLVGERYFSVQGWKKGKVYPDFVVALKNQSGNLGKLYVIETKGSHLKNEDTQYKQDLFEICNQLGVQKDWKELFENELHGESIEFQVVFDDQSRQYITKLFEI